MLDSGLGGLSVLREVMSMLPGEDLLYYGDSAYCPYGGRSPEYVLERTSRITRFLLDHGAKLVVVACNTASSVALRELRRRFDVPIVGMVPAVKPAVSATRSGRISVLATPLTVTGESLAALIREHARGAEVLNVPAPGLVELVEAGLTTGPEAEATLRPLLDPLLKDGVDTLVLGCTHYPFLRDAICSIAGPGVAVVDSGQAVARRVREVLAQRGELRSEGQGSLRLFTSADPTRTSSVASHLLGFPVRAHQVDL